MLSNKHFISQPLIHKPYKNLQYWLKHVVVMRQMQILCIYEGDKDYPGFYEVWNCRSSQAWIRHEINYVQRIHKPFDYDHEAVVYIEKGSLRLQRMLWNDFGIQRPLNIQLPTKTFSQLTPSELDETFPDKYLLYGLTHEYEYELRLLVLLENLTKFESVTGEVCHDTVISSYQDEKPLAEAVVKNKNKGNLFYAQMNDKYGVIYRQNFFNEKLEFYIWNVYVNEEFTQPIVVNLQVNICIIKCYQLPLDILKQQMQKIDINQEQSQNLFNEMHIVFLANSVSGKHPLHIQATVDLADLSAKTYHNKELKLDPLGSLIMQVPWLFLKHREICVLYYTKTMRQQLVIFNYDTGKKVKLIDHTNPNEVLSLYFSAQPECFVSQQQSTPDEEISTANEQEIKNQYKMEDPTGLTLNSFVPVDILLWHYLRHAKVVEVYGERICTQLVDHMFQRKQKVEAKTVKQIKYEIIIDDD